MLITRSWIESQSSRIPRDTGRFLGTLIRMIETPGAGFAPNAQMVEQAPGWVLATHFHREYQFQLFVSGSGTLGRHEVRPLMLHYTSPESGYGPITAGPQGLAYYTLRSSAPAGACYLPEARETMQQGLAKRHAMSQRIAVGAQLPGVAQAADVETCIALDDGGMGAWKVSIAPGGTFAVSQLPGAGARYYYVASGDVGADARMLEAGSILFAHAQPGLILRAGDAGAEVIAMQFPIAASAAV